LDSADGGLRNTVGHRNLVLRPSILPNLLDLLAAAVNLTVLRLDALQR
jgi:hypothetical protein